MKKEDKFVGYSDKINDPFFENYVKNTKKWSLFFSLFIALIAIVGFFIYGLTSDEMDNPQALFIGLLIGGMFILISLITTFFKNRTTTWDGVVIDKKLEKKSRKKYMSNDNTSNDYYWEDYTVYEVLIKHNENNKIHTIRSEDDDTLYNYYNIGDKLRHHAKINTFEKYDKSKDTIIFCNACASMNDIKDDFCHRCKAPLLK